MNGIVVSVNVGFLKMVVLKPVGVLHIDRSNTFWKLILPPSSGSMLYPTHIYSQILGTMPVEYCHSLFLDIF